MMQGVSDAAFTEFITAGIKNAPRIHQLTSANVYGL